MGLPARDAQPVLDAQIMDVQILDAQIMDQAQDAAVEDIALPQIPDMAPDQAPPPAPNPRGCRADTICIAATADVFVDRQHRNENYNTNRLEMTRVRDVLLRFNMGIHQGVVPVNATLILHVERWQPGTQVTLYQTHPNWDESVTWNRSPPPSPPGQLFIVDPQQEEVRWALAPVVQSNLPLNQVVSLRLQTTGRGTLLDFSAHESALMAPPLLEFSLPP